MIDHHPSLRLPPDPLKIKANMGGPFDNVPLTPSELGAAGGSLVNALVNAAWPNKRSQYVVGPSALMMAFAGASFRYADGVRRRLTDQMVLQHLSPRPSVPPPPLCPSSLPLSLHRCFSPSTSSANGLPKPLLHLKDCSRDRSAHGELSHVTQTQHRLFVHVEATLSDIDRDAPRPPPSSP